MIKKILVFLGRTCEHHELEHDVVAAANPCLSSDLKERVWIIAPRSYVEAIGAQPENTRNANILTKQIGLAKNLPTFC